MSVRTNVGKTYGIQFLPKLSILEWNSAQCHLAAGDQVMFVCLLFVLMLDDIIIVIDIIIIMISNNIYYNTTYT